MRHAFTQRDGLYQLGGGTAQPPAAPDRVVEADDVYLGGERNQGSGTTGKAQVIAACERREPGRMGYVAMQVVASFSSDAMQAFRDRRIAPGTQVHTDGLRCFNAFADPARAITHHTTVAGGKRPARERSAPFFCINTLVANLSTVIKATHKAVSPKHLPDYLGSTCLTISGRSAGPPTVAGRWQT